MTIQLGGVVEIGTAELPAGAGAGEPVSGSLVNGAAATVGGARGPQDQTAVSIRERSCSRNLQWQELAVGCGAIEP